MLKHVNFEAVLLLFVKSTKKLCQSSVSFFLFLFDFFGKHEDFDEFLPHCSFPDFDALSDDESVPRELLPTESFPDFDA